jgi:type I restriction enzyme S subunit
MSASKYKPYPKYSDKGIDWLGEVPEHWVISTPRLMFQEIKDKNTDSARTNFLSLVSKKGVIPYEEKGNMGNKMSVNIDHYTIVDKGDFVLNSMNFGIGGFGVSDYDGITSPAYVVLRPIVEESLTRYLAQIFEDEGFQKGTAILGDGIMELRRSIGWKHLKRQPIPIPTHEERMAISRFLESGTDAIDELIPALQSMIVKLEEKRSALITQAVTRGLDPDVQMKDSGIEWLGEIPKHWEVTQLGRQLTLQRGVDITKDEQRVGHVPVVSSGGVASFHDTALVDGPGVVVGRKGSAGRVHWVAEEYWPHDTTLYVKWFGANSRRYVYYKLISMKLETFNTGSANPTVNRNIIHPLHVSWPPLEEQKEIVKLLDSELQTMEETVLLIEQIIDRINDYRTTLVSSAVTGKIDVRESD